MKGYTTLTQFVKDYNLYITAKKIDPGRDGETITSYLKKRIDKGFSSASKQFQNMLKKRNYSIDDLKIIATHDNLKEIPNLTFFFKQCFALNYVNHKYYKKLISSKVFKAGRLIRLHEFIPSKIETKTEFMRFIRAQRRIPKSELAALMKHICKKNWKEWLYESIETGDIRERDGEWAA